MKKLHPSSFVLLIIALVLGYVSIASAATTISTDIATGGTLSVTGASTLTGLVSFGSNIALPAAYSLDVASAGALNIGTTTATSLSFGRTNIISTFFGPVKINGAASTTGDFSVNGNATTTAANGNITTNGSISLPTTGSITLTNGAVTLTNGSLTLANSSTAIGGIVFGFCTINNSTTITASTTAFFNCSGATGVTTSHRIFVQATSSLPSTLIVQSASSTAAGVINLQIFNTGTVGNLAPGAISLNFFGIR